MDWPSPNSRGDEQRGLYSFISVFRWTECPRHWPLRCAGSRWCLPAWLSGAKWLFVTVSTTRSQTMIIMKRTERRPLTTKTRAKLVSPVFTLFYFLITKEHWKQVFWRIWSRWYYPRARWHRGGTCMCVWEMTARACVHTGPDAPLSPPFITDKSVSAVIPRVDATCSPVTVLLSPCPPEMRARTFRARITCRQNLDPDSGRNVCVYTDGPCTRI